jgi:UDP-glucose 4-epimerase
VAGFARHTIEPELAKKWGFKFIECGSFAGPILQRAHERAGPPVAVFHSIGASSVTQAEVDPAADAERTLRTTESLLEALRQMAPSARLIYPSSAAVYGAAAPGPIPEDAPTQPISLYGANKLRAETICQDFARRSGLQVIIARFFSIYGPPQRKLLLWDLGLRLLAGERRITLGGTGEETRDFIHVSDAAAIVVALIVAARPPQLLNAGTGRATSVNILATKFAAAFGVPVDLQFDGRSRPGDPSHQQADISQLSTVGFASSMTLEQGLANYANWLRTASRA